MVPDNHVTTHLPAYIIYTTKPQAINQRLISSIASQQPPLAGGPATAGTMSQPRSSVNKTCGGETTLDVDLVMSAHD
jgi:hypothetical protein